MTAHGYGGAANRSLSLAVSGAPRHNRIWIAHGQPEFRFRSSALDAANAGAVRRAWQSDECDRGQSLQPRLARDGRAPADAARDPLCLRALDDARDDARPYRRAAEDDPRFRRVPSQALCAAISRARRAGRRAGGDRTRALQPPRDRYAMGPRPRRLVGADPDVSQSRHPGVPALARSRVERRRRISISRGS